MARKLTASLVLLLVLAACSSKGEAAGTPVNTTTPAMTPTHPDRPAASMAEAASAGPGSAYQVSIDPSHFSATVDNLWFPLKPGTTYIYEGVKDGKKLVDKFAVTHDTKVVAGVECVVVFDQGFLGDKLAERTYDYYAQDDLGNVWYFGEDTAELNPDGSVSNTEGTWHAGVGGAQPGVFMQADPVVGASFRQEYYAGRAEDQYQVMSLSESVTVPYGTFDGAMLTKETSALEPTVVDHKLYVRGIGEVSEVAAAGPKEQALLVSVKG